MKKYSITIIAVAIFFMCGVARADVTITITGGGTGMDVTSTSNFIYEDPDGNCLTGTVYQNCAVGSGFQSITLSGNIIGSAAVTPWPVGEYNAFDSDFFAYCFNISQASCQSHKIGPIVHFWVIAGSPDYLSLTAPGGGGGGGGTTTPVAAGSTYIFMFVSIMLFLMELFMFLFVMWLIVIIIGWPVKKLIRSMRQLIRRGGQ